MSRTTRVNVTFKINLKYPDRSTFVERFSQNISRTGLFVRAQDPLAVGSRVTFDYRLADNSQVLRGSGIVRWVRTPEEAKEPAEPPGMGIEFIDLDPASETLVGQIVGRFGEGSRAPKKLKANPRAPMTGPPPPARAAPGLDTEETNLLDILTENVVEARAPGVNADALAAMVASEGYDEDPAFVETEVDTPPPRGEPPPKPSWFLLDLAGSDIAASCAGERIQVLPRLRVADGQLHVDAQGIYLPSLISCLGQPWPSPHPAAMARRLGVALSAGARAGETAVKLSGSTVPIEHALRAFAHAALQKLSPHPTPASAAVVVPSQLPAKAVRTVEWLMQDLGFASVRILPNALALLQATPLAPAASDITLMVSVGALSTEIALLEGNTALHPALSVIDLGFWNADGEVHNRIALHLLKQGVDVDDDPSLADELMQQITRLRRTTASRWAIALAGADLQLEVTSVARWLLPASERLMLMCDAWMRNHVPEGRQVKNLVLAGDEPLWPGVQELLHKELGLSPIVLANGAWSRLDGARHHVEPPMHGAAETFQ